MNKNQIKNIGLGHAVQNQSQPCICYNVKELALLFSDHVCVTDTSMEVNPKIKYDPATIALFKLILNQKYQMLMQGWRNKA